MQYTSETPWEVWCVFYHNSDDCFCKTLVSIHLTEDDAQKGLLEYAEKHQKLWNEYVVLNNAEYSNRLDPDKFKICRQKTEEWLKQNNIHSYPIKVSSDLSEYSIEPRTIGDWRFEL